MSVALYDINVNVESTNMEEALNNDVENALKNIINMFVGTVNTKELNCCVRQLVPLDLEDYKIKSVEGKNNHFQVTYKCA